MSVTVKGVIKFVLGILVLLVALGFAGIYYIGAWNILFPSSHHDTTPPEIGSDLQSPAVLVFSKTNRFRHKEGIAGGKKALAEIAAQNDWGVFATENGAVFNAEDLARFDAVVFLNTTGDVFNADQESAFRNWLEQGGGWLGIHAAGDGSHAEWDWYMENLIGTDFIAHIMGPQFQTATVITENPDHPVNKAIPQTWQHEEEWYSWEESPRGNGFNILATVDETTYTPTINMLNQEKDLRMGDHPVVWSNCVGQGRSVYSAMGHRAEAFDSVEHLKLLRDALSWLMSEDAAGCEAGL